MEIFLLLIIAISLSMDAFSLSLIYGTLNIKKNYVIILSLVVGIYHFFMPLLGLLFGNYILDIININTDFIVFLILLVVGLQMVFSNSKDIIIKGLNKFDILLFGLAVSLDSFSVGITVSNITNNIILSSIIFSITSILFTYTGLKLGKVINKKVGTYSSKIGGFILILVAFLYIL